METIQIDSPPVPPKLQRLMVPVPLMKTGIEDFEGSMVDTAVSDIPAVFKEVYKAQKCHTEEMFKRKQTLKTLQEKLDQVEDMKDEIQQEIMCVANRIFQAKENIKERSKLLKELDTGLKSLVEEIVDKKTEIELLEDDVEYENRHQKIETDKLEVFMKEMERYERNSTVGVEIQVVKEKIEVLKLQKDILDKDMEEKGNMLTGKTKEALTADLEELRRRLTVSKQDTSNIENKIKQENNKQSKTTQNIQVLGKKNTAQMTRQKRQLKELQLRNRQRRSQVKQLETNIDQASKSLYN